MLYKTLHGYHGPQILSHYLTIPHYTSEQTSVVNEYYESIDATTLSPIESENLLLSLESSFYLYPVVLLFSPPAKEYAHLCRRHSSSAHIPYPTLYCVATAGTSVSTPRISFKFGKRATCFCISSLICAVHSGFTPGL